MRKEVLWMVTWSNTWSHDLIAPKSLDHPLEGYLNVKGILTLGFLSQVWTWELPPYTSIYTPPLHSLTLPLHTPPRWCRSVRAPHSMSWHSLPNGGRDHHHLGAPYTGNMKRVQKSFYCRGTDPTSAYQWHYYIVITLLLHYYYIIITLLLHYYYIIITFTGFTRDPSAYQ